jgi:hypothetical protein
MESHLTSVFRTGTPIFRLAPGAFGMLGLRVAKLPTKTVIIIKRRERNTVLIKFFVFIKVSRPKSLLYGIC